ncbi:MAG: tripartite tricarboxylate transporter substrate binding protein [Cytophagales bacterium]|nr:tripartite tricarboxylate transporter substrate binding protein [Cytophagales bacterium]
MKMSSLFKQLLAGLALLTSGALLAQSFPNKQINMVVAFPAGGASDFVARVMAKEMQNNLGQPLIVENVVGVAGSLGVLKVANAAPDGYTLITGSPLELILTPLGISAAKNKAEDVRMIAVAGRSDLMLAVRKDFPANSTEQFLSALKADSKGLSYGSTGIGSLYHLMGAKMIQTAGAKGLHVPFNGLAPVLQALGGGQIDFAFLPIAGPVPGYVEAGNVKALAVASNEHSPRFPKLPLMKSIRGFDDFTFSIWAGIQTGAKVPDAAAAILHKSAYAALANPEVKKQLEGSGTFPFAPMSLAELNTFYAKETAMYRAIAKSINLEAQ